MHITSLIPLFSFLAFGGSIGVVDLDDKNAEIRWAAVVQTTVDGVFFSIIREPETHFLPKNGSRRLTAYYDIEDYNREMRNELGLVELTDQEAERRRQVLAWTQNVTEDKNFSPEVKARAAALAEMMASRLNTATIEKNRTEAEATFKELNGKLFGPNSEQLDQTIIKQTDPGSFEAYVGPFRTWLKQSVCRCELAYPTYVEIGTVCALKKGSATLAVSSPGKGMCNTRQDCRSRTWGLRFPGQQPQRFDLDSVLTSKCNDYFALGNLSE